MVKFKNKDKSASILLGSHHLSWPLLNSIDICHPRRGSGKPAVRAYWLFSYLDRRDRQTGGRTDTRPLYRRLLYIIRPVSMNGASYDTSCWLSDTDSSTVTQWIELTTNRVGNGSRSTTATATTFTADDRTPEAQNEFTCAEYSQHH